MRSPFYHGTLETSEATGQADSTYELQFRHEHEFRDDREHFSRLVDFGEPGEGR